MRHEVVCNPQTVDGSFGLIVASKIRGLIIPEGRIYLKRGKHIGINRGFGAEHIWAAHQKEMLKAGFTREEEVVQYVATIVRPGSGVYCEFAGFGNFQRLSVVRSQSGLAVVEFMGTIEDGHYSVVTAYNKTRADGSKVGTIR